MGKRAFRKANRPIEKMDKKSRMVYDYLLLGKSKKEVANLCKVDLNYVHTISKRYHIGIFESEKSLDMKEILRDSSNYEHRFFEEWLEYTGNPNDVLAKDDMYNLYMSFFNEEVGLNPCICMTDRKTLVNKLVDYWSGVKSTKRRCSTKMEEEIKPRVCVIGVRERERSDDKSEIVKPFTTMITTDKEDEGMLLEEKRSSSRRLTDDEVMGILEDVEMGMTNAEVAEKYNISTATVNNKKKEFGLSNTRTKSRKISKNKFSRCYKRVLLGEVSAKDVQKELGISCATYQSYKTEYEKDHPNVVIDKEKPKEPIEIKGVDKLEINKEKPIQVSFTKNVIVGLIDDRHPMPVKTSIFKDIDEELMFDYDRQDEICRNFIEENLFTNGVADGNLIVYVTGLQCALASLIKMSNLMGINLELRHYNRLSNTYKPQKIWEGNDVIGIESQLLSTMTRGDRADFVFGCNAEDIAVSEHFYVITECEYTESESRLWREQTFVVNYDKIWSLFGEKVAKNNNPNIPKRSVHIYDVIIEDGRYKSNVLTKAFNYKG